MWDKAKINPVLPPRFDQSLYDNFKLKGLGDFLDDQLKELASPHPEEEASGLALDVLAFHTTDIGTSQQRKQDELVTEYGEERSGQIDKLVKTMSNLYLLSDPPLEDGKSQENNESIMPVSTRLSHDTLAPYIRERFAKSGKPGQRARRILESRVVDWHDGKNGTPLDEHDLKLIEVGKDGMRSLYKDEERLVKASWEVWEKEKKQEEERQAALVAAKQNEEAERREKIKVQQRVIHNQRWFLTGVAVLGITLGFVTYRSIQATAQALHAEQLTRAKLLFEQGKVVSENNPALGMALALEGWERVPIDEPSVKNDIQEGINSLVLKKQLHEIADNVEHVYPIANNTKVILDRVSQAGEIRQLGDGEVVATLSSEIESIVVNSNGEWLIADYVNTFGELRYTNETTKIIQLPGQVNSLFFDSNKTWFVITYTDAQDELRDFNNPNVAISLKGKVESTFSSTIGDWIVIDYVAEQGERYHFNNVLFRSEFDSPSLVHSGIYQLPGEVESVIFSPDDEWFVIDYISDFGELRYTNEPKKAGRLSGEINDLSFSPDDTFEWVFIDYTSYGLGEVNVVARVSDELRKITNPEEIIQLNSDSARLFIIPGSEWMLEYQSGYGGDIRKRNNITQPVPFYASREEVYHDLTIYYRCDKQGIFFDASRQMVLERNNVSVINRRYRK